MKKFLLNPNFSSKLTKSEMKKLVTVTEGQSTKSGWDPDDFNESCTMTCPDATKPQSCGSNAVFCIKYSNEAGQDFALYCLYESGAHTSFCPGFTFPDSGDSGWEPDWGSGDDSGDNSGDSGDDSGDSGSKTRHEGKGKRL